jgi:quercetin dioxygenase-like cupin family protein
MSFPFLGQLSEASSSAYHPEMVQLVKELKERKRKSRIIIKANEVKWIEKGRQVARSARLIDPRNGFQNSLVNMGLGEIPPHGRTGKHKHTEAYIYIIKGKGHSIVDEKRYDWEEGDALYIPPDTYHQHFNDGEEPAVYLRVVPGPLLLNLAAVLASLNVSLEGTVEQRETAPEYKGEAAYFEGQGSPSTHGSGK